MRRPRPHRLTGSVGRLLAATVLGTVGAALVVTSAARPASAAGPDANLSGAGRNLSAPNLPSLLPTPTPPPAPSTSPPAPGLPGGAALPVLCAPSCPPSGTGGGSGNPAGTARITGHAAPAPRARTGAQPGTIGALGGSSGPGASASSTVTAPQSAGLAVSPPPPVEQLTPLAGISFGQAPYLWPIFLLLDLIAAGAVAFLLRRSWSSTPGGS